MNIPLMCRIWGHKWQDELTLTLEELKPYGTTSVSGRRIKVVELTHCRRCGKPNPAYEDWKKMHTR